MPLYPFLRQHINKTNFTMAPFGTIYSYNPNPRVAKVRLSIY